MELVGSSGRLVGCLLRSAALRQVAGALRPANKSNPAIAKTAVTLSNDMYFIACAPFSLSVNDYGRCLTPR